MLFIYNIIVTVQHTAGDLTVKVLPTETYFTLVKQQLSEQGYAYVRVTGTSMQPLLRHLRDGVFIVPPGHIRRGDIVLFDRKNGRYALHRVIQTGKTGFSMAGDNQWHMETDLPYDQIVGVVSGIERNGKNISCGSLFLRAYSMLVTLLAKPRINLWKILVHVKRTICRSDSEGQRGEIPE